MFSAGGAGGTPTSPSWGRLDSDVQRLLEDFPRGEPSLFSGAAPGAWLCVPPAICQHLPSRPAATSAPPHLAEQWGALGVSVREPGAVAGTLPSGAACARPCRCCSVSERRQCPKASCFAGAAGASEGGQAREKRGQPGLVCSLPSPTWGWLQHRWGVHLVLLLGVLNTAAITLRELGRCSPGGKEQRHERCSAAIGPHARSSPASPCRETLQPPRACRCPRAPTYASMKII